MKPLSIFIYYTRNKRKALPVLGILALAVLGISLSLVLTGTIFDAVRDFVSPYYRVLVVQPNFSKKVSQIDPGFRAEVRRNPHLAALLPVETRTTYGLALGIRQAYPIFGVSDDAMPMLLNATGTRLSAGRLPNSHADEIALHENIARARGLTVGSQIGRDADKDDQLAGKWNVVGIVSGDTVLNLAALDRFTQGRPANEMLLVPRPGQMDALAADLEEIATDKVTLQTPAYWNKFIERILSQYDALLTTINAVIIAVLSIGVGLLNVIYFRQRIGEFGLLAGIGYNRLFLVRRVTLEALFLTLVAWLVGMMFSVALYQLLNVLVFEPQGTTLRVFNMRMLSGTLPVPVFVWLFSTATVVWQLSRLDPVSVIERRD